MKQKDIFLRIDSRFDRELEEVAKFEGRSKIGELRWIVKARRKSLGLDKR